MPILGSARTYQLTPEQVRAISDAWRSWRREPERSRRVIRLVIANWLAYYDLPPDRRPDPDPDVSGSLRLLRVRPRGAGRCPRPVARGPGPWLETTIDAQELLRALDIRSDPHRGSGPTIGPWWSCWRANSTAATTGPIRPPTRRSVGPYLKELPDDGLGDAGRQAMPDAGERRRNRDRPGGSDEDGNDFEREPQLPDAPIPGRAVPLVRPEPAAGVDSGGACCWR